jgi:TetR/AcrR family transcriptional regulator, transcriptional repressor for nem operon
MTVNCSNVSASLAGSKAECVLALSPRLPRTVEPHALATFVLTTMEGGVMLSRSARSVEPFDAAVRQLRAHFALLLTPKRRKPTRKRT